MKLQLVLTAAVLSGSASGFDFGTKIYFRGDDELGRRSGGGLAPGVPLPAAPLPTGPSVALPTAAYPPRLPIGGGAAERRAAANIGGPTSSPPAGCLDCNPGSAPARNHGAGTPNAIVTFLHPYTNKAVTVPMTLPVGKPKLITREDRVIYDYGSFGWIGRYIVVRFYPDGTVRVNYH